MSQTDRAAADRAEAGTRLLYADLPGRVLTLPNGRQGRVVNVHPAEWMTVLPYVTVAYLGGGFGGCWMTVDTAYALIREQETHA